MLFDKFGIFRCCLFFAKMLAQCLVHHVASQAMPLSSNLCSFTAKPDYMSNKAQQLSKTHNKCAARHIHQNCVLDWSDQELRQTLLTYVGSIGVSLWYP